MNPTIYHLSETEVMVFLGLFLFVCAAAFLMVRLIVRLRRRLVAQM